MAYLNKFHKGSIEVASGVGLTVSGSREGFDKSKGERGCFVFPSPNCQALIFTPPRVFENIQLQPSRTQLCREIDYNFLSMNFIKIFSTQKLSICVVYDC